MATNYTCQHQWGGSNWGGNGYGNNTVSNTQTCSRKLVSGSIWDSSTKLVSATFRLRTALGHTSGINASTTYTIAGTFSLTCNGAKVTSARFSKSSSSHEGGGRPYTAFTWWEAEGASVMLTVTDATFLTGLKNNNNITLTFSPENTGFRLIHNFAVYCTAYSVNTGPENLPQIAAVSVGQKITAAKFNEVRSNLNAWATATSKTISITAVSAGTKMTASSYNQLVNAIKTIGLGSPATKSASAKITAADINSLITLANKTSI